VHARLPKTPSAPAFVRVLRSGRRSLVLTCLLAGCSSPDELPSSPWIADDPEETFTAAQLRNPEEVFRWAFRDDRDLRDWDLRGIGLEAELADGGLALRSSTSDPRLSRRVDFDSSAIDVIRVGIDGPPNGVVEVFWAAPSEPFGAGRSLRLLAGRSDPASRGTVLEFPVRDHAEWTGPIGRLRLDPATGAGERIVIRWLAGVKEGLSRTELERIAARPWKVELGQDHRNALLAPLDTSIEREADVPRGGRLRLEYGISCLDAEAFHRVAPVRLEAAVEAAGRAARTVWQVRLEDVDYDRALQWQEAVVDLGDYAGRRATVSLRANAETTSERSTCVVALANPELTGGAPKARSPNVILVSVDTLRADSLSLYGNPRETTPAIDAWARAGGTTFETVVAQAGWTLPSHVSMLTGLDALEHGVNFNSPAPGSLTLLAELFRSAGYRTAAFTGGGWMSPEFGFSQGFDRYLYWRGDNEAELRDHMERLLAWLDGHADRPFFVLFHTYEPHGPYRARQPHFDRLYDGALADRIADVDWEVSSPNTGVSRRRVEFAWRQRPAEDAASDSDMLELTTGLYESGVAYVDEQMERLFRRLRELELEDRTVVALTSDHGEALGEHGLQGHGYLYDDNLLVPLVIAAPDLDRAVSTVEAQVRSLDVMPTLLDLAGLPSPAGIDGRSLVPLMRGEEEQDRPAWSYAPKGNWGVALRAGNEVKYHYSPSPWGDLRSAESLFRPGEDPGELHDLAGRAPETPRLRRRVQERLAGMPAFQVRLQSAPGESLRGRLRGGLAQPMKVHTADMPCDCLAWFPPDTIEFLVPPSTSYTLLFANVAGDAVTVEALDVEGRSGVRPPTSFDLDLNDLVAPRNLYLAGDRWELTDDHGLGDTTGLTFRWNGNLRLTRAEGPAMDRALNDQLRALGYIQ
jgi:arylsulfatase A-like enzyme